MIMCKTAEMRTFKAVDFKRNRLAPTLFYATLFKPERLESLIQEINKLSENEKDKIFKIVETVSYKILYATIQK